MRNDRVADLARRDDARPLHDERHAHAPFVENALAERQGQVLRAVGADRPLEALGDARGNRPSRPGRRASAVPALITSRISGRGFQKLGPPLSLVKKMTVFFSRSMLPQLGEDFAHAVVDRAQGRRVGPPLLLVGERGKAAEVFFGRLDRHVLARLGQVEEERPVLVPLDELRPPRGCSTSVR